MPKTTASKCAPARLLLVSLALAAAAACATPKPLVDPAPIAAAETPAQTRVAILRALIENDWKVESEQPGEIIARYDKTRWNMVVAVDYTEQVSVRYVRSENLEYGTSNGTPVIHGSYNKRVRRLSNEIGTEIAILRATNALPPVAAPPPGAARPQ